MFRLSANAMLLALIAGVFVSAPGAAAPNLSIGGAGASKQRPRSRPVRTGTRTASSSNS